MTPEERDRDEEQILGMMAQAYMDRLPLTEFEDTKLSPRLKCILAELELNWECERIKEESET